MRICSWVCGFIVAATFGSTDVVRASIADAVETGHHPALYQSDAPEEVLVWKSSTHCERVVKDGGRMAVPVPDVLRVGTWNTGGFLMAARLTGRIIPFHRPT